MDLAAVLLAVVTMAAGLAAGWAIARSRVTTETATALAGRDAAAAERDRMRAERDSAMVERERAVATAAEAAGQLKSLEQAEATLKDSFARLSGEALEKSNASFLAMADSRFKLAGAPLTETLAKVETRLREIEKERVGAQQALREQIDQVRRTGDQLRDETRTLVDALRKPQARGRWGELQLRRCVELAGMMPNCDFVEQATVMTADGILRPDLVIRLVGGKSIVVDSKVTLAAYLEAHDATDETYREERLTAHARHLRTHVDQLAAKSYWAQFSPAPEFVMLFVPGEAFLAPALDRDPSLLDDAWSKRVHIVTPTSLISALRAVAYAWQQEALAANAREVFDLGRELYRRLGTLGGHVDKLGRSLTSTVKTYNAAIGSLETQVLVSARKLNEMKVVDTLLVEPGALEETVRPLTKPELVESAEQARAVTALPGSQADYGLDLDDGDLGEPGVMSAS